MKLRALSLALFSTVLILSGCDSNSPSSASDNASPPASPPSATQLAALAAINIIPGATNPDNGFPAFDVPTGKTVALFDPFNVAAADFIPFPVDLLFNGSTDGTLNLPGEGNSNSADSIDLSAAPGLLAAASPKAAINTLDGFSTTAMMVLRFSAPILNNQSNLAAGIRIFEMNGSVRRGVSVSDANISRELVYGVDFVASINGNNVVLLPLRPLQSAHTYRVVVTADVTVPDGAGGTITIPGLKDASGNSVVAYGAYQAQRAGVLALFPDVQTFEAALASYTSTHPFPPTVMDPSLGGARPVPLIPADIDHGVLGNIAFSYSLTTQDTTSALQQAQGIVAASPAPVIAVGAVPAAYNTPLTSAAAFNAPNTQIYLGQISGMTSFLKVAGMSLNPLDGPVHSVWENAGKNLSPLNHFKPDVKGTAIVPLLVTAPASTAMIDLDGPGPATAVPCSAAYASDGYPVVIFQHGITSNRGSMLALAGALTRICAVGVAIDLPEHGIDPNDPKFGTLAGALSPTGPTGERLVAFGAGQPGAGNAIGCMQGAPIDVTGAGDLRCKSGDSFINLANLANSRDVLRQAVIDLDSLYKAITAIAGGNVAAVDMGDGTTDKSFKIDADKISFVGMSLGSIVGETFVATLPTTSGYTSPLNGSLVSAVFNVGGGGIAKLLDGSPSFEPVITTGLSAQGVTKPSADYESFLMIAQTLIDSADPINYAGTLSELKSTTPILFQEIVGDGATAGSSDQVVPNNVFGQLSGPAASPLAQAWAAVSGGGATQAVVSGAQNIYTSPSPLGGTDPLVQGTSFISLATAASGDASAAACAGAYGPLCPAIAMATSGAVVPFTGIGLPGVKADGTITVPVGGAPTNVPASFGVVRLAVGGHSSLLDPSVSAPATVMMQTQVANFIATASQGSSSIVGESACAPTCTGTIAGW